MYKITNANIKEWAKNYDGELFDGILCDPPYELGFMGKSWDSSGIAFDSEMWADIFKLLKPGGHLLAFSGSRTYHRMAVAIEDAGFEIRDQLIWMYGSGFPKSLNIGKAVDKIQGNEREQTTNNVTCPDFPNPCNGHPTANRSLGGGANRHALPTKGTSEWEGYGTALKPAHEPCVLARKPLEGTVANNVLKHGTGGLNIDGTRVGTTGARFNGRKVDSDIYGKYGVAKPKEDYNMGRFPANLIHDGSDEVEAVFPQTGKSQVRKVKPSHEPCVLARKPIDGTVANNVLKHGTGGLNIDGTRVGTEEKLQGSSSGRPDIRGGNFKTYSGANPDELGYYEANTLGRFPANLIHDGSDEVEAVFPQTGKPKPARSGIKGGKTLHNGGWKKDTIGYWPADSGGSASRYFYTAKASKSERNLGLDSTVSIRVQLEICENSITRQENLAQLQVVMDNSHLKATAESGIGTKSGTEWSMSLFGNQYTEKYPINTKSTTKTTTSSTTTSVILNWLIGLLTNESTLGVNLEMASGGSLVESAESSNTLIATINDQTALALGVNPAQANKRLLISVSDGKNFHSTVKPLSLTKYLATLIKPPTGGRLLVPFSGSGSEMIGALQAGWEYVEGVELTEEYIPIAEARIKYWLDQITEEDKQPKQVSLV